VGSAFKTGGTYCTRCSIDARAREPHRHTHYYDIQYCGTIVVKTFAERRALVAPLEFARDPELDWGRQGKFQMMAAYPVRKASPAWGKPMKFVADEKGMERYVCANCGDPLQNPVARKWADSRGRQANSRSPFGRERRGAAPRR
jgi:hypothetical protein